MPLSRIKQRRQHPQSVENPRRCDRKEFLRYESDLESNNLHRNVSPPTRPSVYNALDTLTSHPHSNAYTTFHVDFGTSFYEVDGVLAVITTKAVTR
jgi:hypothetical protein